MRTGLIGVVPTGPVLCVEKTILLDEWAGGGCPSDETDAGRILEGYGGRGVLFIVPAIR